MNADEAAAAIIEALNATYATPRAANLETAGADPSNKILVVGTRRYLPPNLLSGELSVRGGYVTFNYVAEHYDTVADFRTRVSDVIEAQILSEDCGPFIHQTSTPTEQDGDRWVGSDTYTF